MGTSKRQPKEPNNERRLSVRSIRRDPVDAHKLARALLSIVVAAAEKAAEDEQRAKIDDQPEART